MTIPKLPPTPKTNPRLVSTAVLPPTLFNNLCVFLSFHMIYAILPLSPLVLTTLAITDLSTSLSIPLLSPLVDSTIIATSVAYFSNMFLSAMPSSKPMPPSLAKFNKCVENHWLIERTMSYLPIKLLVLQPEKFTADKKFIFAAHPHGALAFNRAAVGFCTIKLWDVAFPELPNFRVLAATAAFYVPIVRELWRASYCIDASKSNALKALNRDNCSLFVYPGGEAEQMMSEKGKEKVYVLKRNGFIRLALETNADVVPTYAFGESDLYDHSTLFLKQRLDIMHKYKAAIVFLYGRCGLMPHRTGKGITVAFGCPLGIADGDKSVLYKQFERGEAGTKEHISKEEVEYWHSIYLVRLKELFDSEKAALGYGDRVLEIF